LGAIYVQGNFRLRRFVPVERSGNGSKALERVTPLNWGVPVGRKGEARCAPREQYYLLENFLYLPIYANIAEKLPYLPFPQYRYMANIQNY